MWQQRHSLSVCIWFQDWAHLGPKSTVPMCPQPRLFTLQLFLDFRSNFFPERPLNFLVITIHQVIWPSPGTLFSAIRPPYESCKNILCSGPPEMPLRNWYNCGTKHFKLTINMVVRWKLKTQLEWVIEPVPHDLVRRIRFWRIKSPEQDLKYLYWTISKILFWNLFTCKATYMIDWVGWTLEGTDFCCEQVFPKLFWTYSHYRHSRGDNVS